MSLWNFLFTTRAQRDATDPVRSAVKCATAEAKRATNELTETVRETLEHNDMLRTRALKHHVDKDQR